MSGYRSPCCDVSMPYRIYSDAYVCAHCKKEYEVISVEHTHVLYDGGGPRERSSADMCISCGAKTDPMGHIPCGH